jgi:hypothetical protein
VPRNLSRPARLRQDETPRTSRRGHSASLRTLRFGRTTLFSWVPLPLAPGKKGERSVFKVSGSWSVVLGAVDKAFAVASVVFSGLKNLWSSFPKALEAGPNLLPRRSFPSSRGRSCSRTSRPAPHRAGPRRRRLHRHGRLERSHLPHVYVKARLYRSATARGFDPGGRFGRAISGYFRFAALARWRMSAFNQPATHVKQNMDVLDLFGWFWSTGPRALQYFFGIPATLSMNFLWSLVLAIAAGFLFARRRSRPTNDSSR